MLTCILNCKLHQLRLQMRLNSYFGPVSRNISAALLAGSGKTDRTRSCTLIATFREADLHSLGATQKSYLPGSCVMTCTQNNLPGRQFHPKKTYMTINWYIAMLCHGFDFHRQCGQ